MFNKLNGDWETRNKILAPYSFGYQDESDPDNHLLGGIFSFRFVPVTVLQDLLDLGFADPEDVQNESPTFKEFVDFMNKYPFYTAHGYAVSHERSDYRVTIEGIETTKDVGQDVELAFASFAGNADELAVPTFCWWD